MSGDDQTADDEDVSGITRRRLVAMGTAGWASVSLAGCSRVLDPSMTGAGDSGGGSGGGGGGGGSDGSSDGGSDGSSDGGSDGGSDDTTTPGGNTTVTNETTTTGESDGGATETPTGTGTACANIRRFAAGMNVGIHVMAFDNDSGSVLGADAIERIVVEFLDADFDPLQLNWEGDHEAYTDISWGGMISTSEDLDPGTYQYEITVHRENSEPETIIDEFTIV